MARRIDPSLIPLKPSLTYERQLWSQDLTLLGGIDEAGRGALAGPVYAAVVILPKDAIVAEQLFGVRDSKCMTPKQRAYWEREIKKTAISWSAGSATSEEIDSYGIVPATRLAIQRAIATLKSQPEHLLIDALVLPECPIPQTTLIKGDMRSLSIAAASVIAKESRDAILRAMDSDFPEYSFAQHKGYGTQRHRDVIKILGPSSVHRMSFSPMRNQ